MRLLLHVLHMRPLMPWRKRNREHKTKSVPSTLRGILGDDRSPANIEAHAGEIACLFERDDRAWRLAWEHDGEDDE